MGTKGILSRGSTFRGNKQENKKDKESRPRGVTCLSYVHGLSEKLKSILSTASIKVAFKPRSSLSSKFHVPKARLQKEKAKAIFFSTNVVHVHLYI